MDGEGVPKAPPSTAEMSVLPGWERHFAKTQKTFLSMPRKTKKPPLQVPRYARRPRRRSKRAQGHGNGTQRAPQTLQKAPPERSKNVENDAPAPTGAPKRKMRKITTHRHQGTAKDLRRDPNRNQEHATKQHKCAQGRHMDGETAPKAPRALQKRVFCPGGSAISQKHRKPS